MHESRNLLQRAVLNCHDGLIHVVDRRLSVAAAAGSPGTQALPAIERAHVRVLLDLHDAERALP